MRKLIAFDDETFDKLTQLARDRMATHPGARRRGLRRPAQEARHSRRPQGRVAQERALAKHAEKSQPPRQTREIMTPDPDPFEQGQRAARRKTSRPKPIPIRTAANSMRCGPPAMSRSPARRRPARTRAVEIVAADGPQPIFFRPFFEARPVAGIEFRRHFPSPRPARVRGCGSRVPARR